MILLWTLFHCQIYYSESLLVWKISHNHRYLKVNFTCWLLARDKSDVCSAGADQCRHGTGLVSAAVISFRSVWTNQRPSWGHVDQSEARRLWTPAWSTTSTGRLSQPALVTALTLHSTERRNLWSEYFNDQTILTNIRKGFFIKHSQYCRFSCL